MGLIDGWRVDKHSRHHARPNTDAVREGGGRCGHSRRSPTCRPPAGAELVLEVDDVAEARERVVRAGWPLEDDLTSRPWGWWTSGSWTPPATT
ncbi:VOC family protein [Dactylosporangium sp. NPDC048998]|uniref:VOC family protein n=1 Tax=Dactylosporangium sp. NPDC048998 TaxID=3363976 RepID=UPI0037148601